MPDEVAGEYFRARYTATQVEGLVRGHGTLWIGKDSVQVRRDSWAEIRARTESPRPGLRFDLEDEAWLEVLDLERALQDLASPNLQGRRNLRGLRERAASAAAISAVLLCGFTTQELKYAFGHEWDVERLIRKGSAWLAERLSGGTEAACDERFRRAR